MATSRIGARLCGEGAEASRASAHRQPLARLFMCATRSPMGMHVAPSAPANGCTAAGLSLVAPRLSVHTFGRWTLGHERVAAAPLFRTPCVEEGVAPAHAMTRGLCRSVNRASAAGSERELRPAASLAERVFRLLVRSMC